MTKSKTTTTDPTLYRKYRPSVFKDVVGQDHVLRVLRGAFARNRVTHAYLFAGPRGTGKTTVARLLAKRLNCERPKDVEPCGHCTSCAAVAHGAHLDLIEIDAASNRGIDDVRLLKERISLSPAAGEKKVYIIDEVHMLSKDAFNALLKTLEEPPTHAVFVLATTELEKVPETIRSRCQTLIFRRAPVPVIVERLQGIARAEGLQATPDALRTIAAVSGGCFRDAESFLAMVASVTDKKLTEDIVTNVLGLAPLSVLQEFTAALLRRDAPTALALIRELTEEGHAIDEFTDLLVRYFRALAAWAVAGVHAETFTTEEEERFRSQATERPLSELVALLRLALRAKYDLRDVVYEELPLELLALEWCGGDADKKQEARNTEHGAINALPATGETDTKTAEAVPARAKAPAKTAQERANIIRPPTPDIPLILDRWPAFLRALSSLHPLLLPMLARAIPLEARDGTLFVLSDHALAHDRLKDTDFRHQLEERLEQVLGVQLRLKLVRERELMGLGIAPPESSVRDKALAAAGSVQPVAEPVLADALSILGGEVVEPRPSTG